MAEVKSSVQTKLQNLQILVFLFTSIPIAVIGFWAGERISVASQKRDQAHDVMAVNSIIDAIDDLQRALAADFLVTHTGYGYADKVKKPLFSEIIANQNAVLAAYSDVSAKLEDLYSLHHQNVTIRSLEYFDKLVRAQMREYLGDKSRYTEDYYDFDARVKALKEAYERYREQAETIEQDLGTSASERELRPRATLMTTQDFIDTADQLRNTLAVGYDFGDLRISQILHLKHQLGRMTVYTMRTAGRIGGIIAAGERISDMAKLISMQNIGYRDIASSQVIEIMGSPFIVPNLISAEDRSRELEAIHSKLIYDFDSYLYNIIDTADYAEDPAAIDYDMTGLDWIEKSQAANAPVNDMALQVKTICQDLTQKAVLQAVDEYAAAVKLLGIVLIGAAVVWFFVFLSFRSVTATAKS